MIILLKRIKKKLLKYFSKFAPPRSSFKATILRWAGYKIGKNGYIGRGFLILDQSQITANVVIGDRVSIGDRLSIITCSSPLFQSELSKYFKLVSKKVVIEDDVWIGVGAIILPGVTIGKCSVIGSGALVTKDIPPYSVAVGNPAKVIKTIDKDNPIDNPSKK